MAFRSSKEIWGIIWTAIFLWAGIVMLIAAAIEFL
jgi:hypothetical protein